MDLIVKDFVFNSDELCSECGSDKTSLKGELSFVQLLYIPIFPVSTKYKLVCSNCRATKYVSRSEHGAITAFEFYNKFIGLLIIPVLFLIYSLYEQKLALTEKEVLGSPQALDFYIINNKKFSFNLEHTYNFVVAKVVDVSEREVRFQLGSYSYQKERGVIKDIRSDKLLTNHYFTSSIYTIPIEKLIEFRNEGRILMALRPKNLTLFGGLVVTPSEAITHIH